jgi:hypothetical protein
LHHSFDPLVSQLSFVDSFGQPDRVLSSGIQTGKSRTRHGRVYTDPNTLALRDHISGINSFRKVDLTYKRGFFLGPIHLIVMFECRRLTFKWDTDRCSPQSEAQFSPKPSPKSN